VIDFNVTGIEIHHNFMSDSIVGCCTPACPTPITVNIPGTPGAAGAAGTAGLNGINSYTITTSNFTVPPAIGNTVTIEVGVSSWAVVGQNVFIAGPSNWTVTAIPTAASLTVRFLGYVGDVAPNTPIGAGAGVSPSGLIGTSQTLLPAITSYVTGGSQALTNSSVQLLTTNVTLTTIGSYLLMARLRLDFVGATFAANQTVTIKLREVTNGPADLANTTVGLGTGTPTTVSSTMAAVSFPPVIYAAAANDKIEIFGVVSVAPGAGSLQAIEGSIVAIKLF
jgi:hypothetical protein